MEIVVKKNFVPVVSHLAGGPLNIHGKDWPLVKSHSRIIIGRDSSSDICADIPEVSRRHAQVALRNDNEIFLTDLGSSNGTRFRNQKLKSNQPVKLAGQSIVVVADKIILGIHMVPAEEVTARLSQGFSRLFRQFENDAPYEIGLMCVVGDQLKIIEDKEGILSNFFGSGGDLTAEMKSAARKLFEGGRLFLKADHSLETFKKHQALWGETILK